MLQLTPQLALQGMPEITPQGMLLSDAATLQLKV
jgi:hypothetical protein